MIDPNTLPLPEHPRFRKSVKGQTQFDVGVNDHKPFWVALRRLSRKRVESACAIAWKFFTEVVLKCAGPCEGCPPQCKDAAAQWEAYRKERMG